MELEALAQAHQEALLASIEECAQPKLSESARSASS
jgi:hypothetical protein